MFLESSLGCFYHNFFLHWHDEELELDKPNKAIKLHTFAPFDNLFKVVSGLSINHPSTALKPLHHLRTKVEGRSFVCGTSMQFMGKWKNRIRISRRKLQTAGDDLRHYTQLI